MTHSHHYQKGDILVYRKRPVLDIIQSGFIPSSSTLLLISVTMDRSITSLCIFPPRHLLHRLAVELKWDNVWKGRDKPSGTRQLSIIILFLKWSDIQDNAVSTFESYCLGLLSCLLSLCSQSTSFLRRPFTYTHLVFLGPWVGKPEVSLSGTLFSVTQ